MIRSLLVSTVILLFAPSIVYADILPAEARRILGADLIHLQGYELSRKYLYNRDIFRVSVELGGFKIGEEPHYCYLSLSGADDKLQIKQRITWDHESSQGLLFSKENFIITIPEHFQEGTYNIYLGISGSDENKRPTHAIVIDQVIIHTKSGLLESGRFNLANGNCELALRGILGFADISEARDSQILYKLARDLREKDRRCGDDVHCIASLLEGISEYHKGNYEPAISMLKKAGESGYAEKIPCLEYWLGLALLKKGDMLLAVRHLRKALRRRAMDMRIYHALHSCLIELGEVEEANSLLNKAYVRCSRSYLPSMLLGAERGLLERTGTAFIDLPLMSGEVQIEVIASGSLLAGEWPKMTFYLEGSPKAHYLVASEQPLRYVHSVMVERSGVHRLFISLDNGLKKGELYRSIKILGINIKQGAAS